MTANISFLDDIRVNKGKDVCIEEFNGILKKNKRRGVNLLNDKNLSFTALFILIPDIDKFELFQFMNFRNKIAVKIVKQILNKRDFNNDIDYLSNKNPKIYPVLKWMLGTGYEDDFLNDDYEEVMDVVVSVLIDIYRDKSILNIVNKMIVKRNKEGHYIHDLVWAFFRFHDPYSLKLMAENIKSSEPENVKLACSLLNINNINCNEEISDNQDLYDFYINWLKENDPFLYFTGECLQYTSNPEICSIDEERKYMCKGIPEYDKRPIKPTNDYENKRLNTFNPLCSDDKLILACYSYKMFKENKAKWKKWFNSPIEEQIEIARKEFLGEYV